MPETALVSSHRSPSLQDAFDLANLTLDLTTKPRMSSTTPSPSPTIGNSPPPTTRVHLAEFLSRW
jgi:hypothetical protein